MASSNESIRAELLRQRTQRFAIAVLRLCRQFPRTIVGYVIAKQLIKASTSVAANYRAACRSRSRNDFISKISTVCEEADESQFWLDVTIAAEVLNDSDSRALLKEASELSAIFGASRATAKRQVFLQGILSIMAILAIVAMVAA